MKYLIQPFQPGYGKIVPMVSETELDAGELARAWLRTHNDAVCVVTMTDDFINANPRLTLSVYAGVNVPMVI